MDTAAEKVFRCKLENVVGKPLQTILPNVNLPKEATHVSIFNFRTTQHESLQILQKTFKNTFGFSNFKSKVHNFSATAIRF